MAKTNCELKIEKGIPLPRAAAHITETMRAMEVGDSVVLHSAKATAYSNAQRVLGRGCYTLAKEGDGFRVWRIK